MYTRLESKVENETQAAKPIIGESTVRIARVASLSLRFPHTGTERKIVGESGRLRLSRINFGADIFFDDHEILEPTFRGFEEAILVYIWENQCDENRAVFTRAYKHGMVQELWAIRSSSFGSYQFNFPS